ncbi:MAG: hypothetical protein JWN70_4995 [Planctomycetaceae bacterium]|nr:hypothetical protein [Planctomycetaceae bacterium]
MTSAMRNLLGFSETIRRNWLSLVQTAVNRRRIKSPPNHLEHVDSLEAYGSNHLKWTAAR